MEGTLHHEHSLNIDNYNSVALESTLLAKKHLLYRKIVWKQKMQPKEGDQKTTDKRGNHSTVR